MNSRGMLRWGGRAVGAALALALSGCAGDDASSAAPADGEPAATASSATSPPAVSGPGVEVVAKDIAFAPTEIVVGAAPARITLRNEGAIVHSLVIDGAPNFEKLEVAANGASDSTMLDVAPGTYTAYCDQPGHRAAGMEMKLTVG